MLISQHQLSHQKPKMSNSHELYVKSLREPIQLSKLEAEAISALLEDPSKDNQTKISIEGVWTGSKGEIKFIKYPKKEPERPEFKKVAPMSAVQGKAFEERILPHQIEAEVSGFGTFQWELFYAQKSGVLRVELVRTKTGEHLVPVITDPNGYMALQDEIEAYKLWKSRQEYAERKRLESLEETL